MTSTITTTVTDVKNTKQPAITQDRLSTFKIPTNAQITPYQKRVYALLLEIPAGKISTYAYLSKALNSSPRAVGGALRTNPFAPEIPCHRVIAASGFVGGFMGDWQKAPSGQNQSKKLALLGEEGVRFDSKGMLIDKTRLFRHFKV